ncbi:MAG TPA: RNA polymerase sigma factor FliA [Rhodocyclaceae bacterium]|jgi:RNA polymerase sigma factor for flagellar operon FliA|nr:RNA polymerase sigma factor FliA [Rhodocyclaceae bacterium]
MYNAQGVFDKQELVVQYAPLVKRIAYHLMARLPSSVQVDDLIQNGMLGLLDACARFEDGQGAQFETYAVQRIRGAMLDGLRENDWVPRSVRRDMRRVETAMLQLEHQHGRQPTETELAAALDMPLAEYQRLLGDARGHQLLSLEDLGGVGDDEEFLDRHETGTTQDPLSLLLEDDLRAVLVRGINALPEREKLVMSLYYEEELNLREIGEVLEVTESRVCQLHSQAIARLRAQVLDENGKLPAKRRGRPRKSPAAEA